MVGGSACARGGSRAGPDLFRRAHCPRGGVRRRTLGDLLPSGSRLCV